MNRASRYAHLVGLDNLVYQVRDAAGQVLHALARGQLDLWFGSTLACPARCARGVAWRDAACCVNCSTALKRVMMDHA